MTRENSVIIDDGARALRSNPNAIESQQKHGRNAIKKITTKTVLDAAAQGPDGLPSADTPKKPIVEKNDPEQKKAPPPFTYVPGRVDFQVVQAERQQVGLRVGHPLGVLQQSGHRVRARARRSPRYAKNRRRTTTTSAGQVRNSAVLSAGRTGSVLPVLPGRPRGLLGFAVPRSRRWSFGLTLVPVVSVRCFALGARTT